MEINPWVQSYPSVSVLDMLCYCSNRSCQTCSEWKINYYYYPVPSDRFNKLDPEELSTMDLNDDTPEHLLDYHMFHRQYEVKIIKNKLVKQANDAKRAENEAIKL